MMVKKQCPNCFRQSYSSTAKGIWICPYCHSDITDAQAKEIDVRGDRLNLLKQRHDWKQLAPRNRGPLMVECDYNYPGGFYIRHKEAFRYCITGNRLDIENMIENALAALGENCGRIILYDEAEKKWFDEVKSVALEGLDIVRRGERSLSLRESGKPPAWTPFLGRRGRTANYISSSMYRW